MTAMFDGIKVTGRFDSRDTSFTTFLQRRRRTPPAPSI